MSSFSYYPHYERPRPLPAQGGIPARNRRGPIGETWWSQRFIELLESFGVGSRLKRGRTYARAGQVVELEVEPGLVLAKVQGSHVSPLAAGAPDALLRELGPAPVEADGRNITDLLAPAYTTLAQAAERRALAE